MPHTVVYMIGICIFLLCFIGELSCGIMTKLIYCMCCSCLDLQEREVTHSTDIYNELSPEDQQHEFYMTNRVLKKIEGNRTEHQKDDQTALLNFYDERIQLKLLKQRFRLAQEIRERKLGKSAMRDTKQAFFALQKSKSIGRKDYKIRGLYSYNILDHPDYIKCQKIEKRIINYIYKAKQTKNKEKAKSMESIQTNTFAAMNSLQTKIN